MDARAIPVRDRTGFVTLTTRRAAPFDDPESDIVWNNSHAYVWYWSASKIRQLSGPLAASTRLYAEASHRGIVRDESALELLNYSHDSEGSGVEGRLWRGGHLVATRWWSEPPSTQAWQLFLRGAGIPATQPTPSVSISELRDKALGTGKQLGDQLLTQWPMFVAAGGLILLAGLCWQLAGVAHAYAKNREIETRITQLEGRLESVITARNIADELSANIDSLTSLRPPSSQTRLMAEISRITPTGDWSVLQWHQPGPETLEVTLRGNGLDASAIVAAWEKSPLLHDVAPSTSSRPGELSIQARITRMAGVDE